MVRGDGTGCSGWSRHCDHAAAVRAVRRVLSAFGSVPRQSGGHSSCMQILGRTVTVTVLGMVVDAPVVVQRLAENCGFFHSCSFGASSSSWTRLLCPLVQRLGSRNAWFDDGYMLLSRVAFGRISTISTLRG